MKNIIGGKTVLLVYEEISEMNLYVKQE